MAPSGLYAGLCHAFLVSLCCNFCPALLCHGLGAKYYDERVRIYARLSA